MYDYYDFVCDCGDPSPPPADWPAPKVDGYYTLVRYPGNWKPQLRRCDSDFAWGVYAQAGEWLQPHRIESPVRPLAADVRDRVFAALQQDDGREVVLDFQDFPNPTSAFLEEVLAGLYLEHGPRAGALRAANLDPSIDPEWSTGWGAWHLAMRHALDKGLAAQDALLETC